MRYINIPNTQLSPSTICLGTAPFGTDLDEDGSFELMDTFLEHGGAFLDTARAYGEWVPGGAGRSEKIIGKWLKERGVRDRFIIATKGAHPHLDTMHLSRLSHDEIVGDLDASLQNLQLERIDLYWLHRDDPTRPVSDILATLNEQVTKGKIHYFGCSNWRLSRIVEAAQYAAQHHIAGFVANQLMWSYAIPNLDAIADKSLVAMDAQTSAFHRQTGMAALAYTPQARGFFSKLNAATLPDQLRNVYDNAQNRERLQRLQTVSSQLSLPIPTLLLAYLSNQSFPAFPIAASSNRRQLLENLQAGDVVLSPETLRYLEDGMVGE